MPLTTGPKTTTASKTSNEESDLRLWERVCDVFDGLCLCVGFSQWLSAVGNAT